MDSAAGGPDEEVPFRDLKLRAAEESHQHHCHHVTGGSCCTDSVCMASHRSDTDVVQNGHAARLDATQNEQASGDIDGWPDPVGVTGNPMELHPQGGLHDRQGRSQRDEHPLWGTGPASGFCEAKKEVGRASGDWDDACNQACRCRREDLAKVRLEREGCKSQCQKMDEVGATTEEYRRSRRLRGGR